jgi:hypothetical protein
MVKLLISGVTKHHRSQNKVSDIITHVTIHDTNGGAF